MFPEFNALSRELLERRGRYICCSQGYAYSTQSLMGKLWKVYYQLYAGKEEAHEKGAQKIDGLTREVFQKTQTAMEAYIEGLSRGYTDNLSQAKTTLRCFNAFIAPFCPIRNEWVKKLNTILKLEEKLETIPFQLLFQCAQGKALSEDVILQLGERLNQTGMSLHEPLSSLVTIWKKTYPEKQFSLPFLEQELWKRGVCSLIPADPHHLAWRNGLKPGDQVGPYILGEYLGGNKEKEKDRFITFAIQGYEDRVLRIGGSCSSFGIEEYLRDDCFSYFSPPKVIEIDPEERFAVVEKLYFPPSQLISRMIQQFIKEECTPVDLSVSHVMTDSLGELCATQAIEKGPYFQYSLLERFVVAFCKEDQNRYCSLLKTSGLASHEEVGFFKEVVQKTLYGGYIDLKDPAAKMRNEQAIQLKQSVQALLKRVKKENPFVNPSEILDHLWEYYCRSGVVSFLKDPELFQLRNQPFCSLIPSVTGQRDCFPLLNNV